jgi:hypothetical protein
MMPEPPAWCIEMEKWPYNVEGVVKVQARGQKSAAARCAGMAAVGRGATKYCSC